MSGFTACRRRETLAKRVSRCTLRHSDVVDSVAYRADGTIACGSDDETIQILKPSTKQKQKSFSKTRKEAIFA